MIVETLIDGLPDMRDEDIGDEEHGVLGLCTVFGNSTLKLEALLESTVLSRESM